MKVLVIGGTGNISREVVAALLGLNHEVVLFNRVQFSGLWSNVASCVNQCPVRGQFLLANSPEITAGPRAGPTAETITS